MSFQTPRCMKTPKLPKTSSNGAMCSYIFAVTMGLPEPAVKGTGPPDSNVLLSNPSCRPHLAFSSENTFISFLLVPGQALKHFHDPSGSTPVAHFKETSVDLVQWFSYLSFHQQHTDCGVPTLEFQILQVRGWAQRFAFLASFQ